MSARMFFSRYPDLYPFLLHQMAQAAKIIEKTPSALSPDETSIYPALLILAKLTPTATITDVEDIKFRVRAFSGLFQLKHYRLISELVLLLIGALIS